MKITGFPTNYTLAFAGSFDKGIVASKSVAANTVGFFGKRSRRQQRTAGHVFGVRDRLKMLGVNATWSSAQMVAYKTWRDFADKKLVNYAICFLCLLSANRGNNVSSPLRQMNPIPARSSAKEMVGRYTNPFQYLAYQNKFLAQKSDIVNIGHGIFSFVENSVARLVSEAQTLMRAVSILARIFRIQQVAGG